MVTGFAVVADSGSERAVWLVSRDGVSAVRSNAVLFDGREGYGEHEEAALLEQRVLLSADRPDPDLERMDRRRRDLQEALNKAARSVRLKAPFEAHEVEPVTFAPATEEGTVRQALAMAEYVEKVWTRWLKTEAERVSRLNHARRTDLVPKGLASAEFREGPWVQDFWE